MILQSEDGLFTVEVLPHCLDALVQYAAKAGRKEIGGILVGRYKDDLGTAVVKCVLGPSTDSSSGTTWFKRGVKGIKDILDKKWVQGQYYIGEWHFHPYADPKPSHHDIREMGLIARSTQYKCPEPVLLILGGSPSNYAISVHVATQKSGLISLLST